MNTKLNERTTLPNFAYWAKELKVPRLLLSYRLLSDGIVFQPKNKVHMENPTKSVL